MIGFMIGAAHKDGFGFREEMFDDTDFVLNFNTTEDDYEGSLGIVAGFGEDANFFGKMETSIGGKKIGDADDRSMGTMTGGKIIIYIKVAATGKTLGVF